MKGSRYKGEGQLAVARGSSKGKFKRESLRVRIISRCVPWVFEGVDSELNLKGQAPKRKMQKYWPFFLNPFINDI